MLCKHSSGALSEKLGVEPQAAWSILDSTKAKAYSSCPRRCMYEHVFGWRLDFPSNHLVFGQAVHLALEYLLIHGYGAEQVEAAFKLFETEYRKTFGPEYDDAFHPKTPDNFFHVLVAYAQYWQSDLFDFDVIYTEIGGSVSIGKDRAIHFKMDSVLRDKKTGLITSLDHKTAGSFRGWSEQFFLSLQTGTYTHVLNCLFPPEQIEGVVYNGLQMAKTKKGWAALNRGALGKETNPIDFLRVTAKKDKGQMQTWLWTINDIYENFQRDYDRLLYAQTGDAVLKAFPMKEGSCSSWGRTCEYHDFCLAWQNPLQKIDQVPIGFMQEWWNPVEEELKQEFNL